jgi:hypothetical protein
LGFLHIIPLEQVASVLIPKSIPIGSVFGLSLSILSSSISTDTLNQKLIPSYDNLGLKYLTFSPMGILCL